MDLNTSIFYFGQQTLKMCYMYVVSMLFLHYLYVNCMAFKLLK